MGLSVLNQPAASSGGIKSVQRGLAAGSGNVTITAVDINKSFVTVYGTTSSGTVAASGTINASNGNINAQNGSFTFYGTPSSRSNGGNTNSFLQPSGASGSAGMNYVDVNNTPSSSLGYYQNFSISNNSSTFAGNSTSLTGGSNNLVAAVVQGYLSNSTTLVVSGACRWEVVEFN